MARLSIPWQSLSEAALRGVLEEFVTRDGTELSDSVTKIAAVKKALAQGELVLVYNPETESCNIVPAESTG